MAISKPLIVSINQDKTRPNEKMFIYRNDIGVDMYIELTNLTYKFDGSKNFKFANALFKTPSDIVYTVNNLSVIDGKIKFSFNEEVVSHIQEIGKYELQFQIFDIDKNRLTIPSYYFDVKEPLGNTQVNLEEGVIDFAHVDYSYITEDTNVALFAVEDGYIKTNWQTGDLITSERMNNIEDGISMALSKEANVTYISDKPSTVAVGGLPLGYTSDGISLVKLIDDMLHPYKAPSITLSISPNTTLYELGKVISSLIISTSPKQGSRDIESVKILKNNSVVSSGTANIKLTETNVKEDVTYGATVSDGTTTVNSNTISIKFINPIYIGSLSTVDATNIKTMTKRVVNVSNQNYTYNITNKRMCIAIPSGWTLKTIIDANGFDVTKSFTKSTINIYCLDGVSRPYTVYYSEPTSQSNFTVKFNF